jgi:hypothetical protein
MAVVLDNSGAQTSGHGAWPDGITSIPVPADSPELHPGERWFKEVREPLANQVYHSLEPLEEPLTAALQFYWEHPTALVPLTAYPWWREGVQYLTTFSQ